MGTLGFWQDAEAEKQKADEVQLKRVATKGHCDGDIVGYPWMM